MLTPKEIASRNRPYNVEFSCLLDGDGDAFAKTPSVSSGTNIWTCFTCCKLSGVGTTRTIIGGGSSTDNRTYVGFNEQNKLVFYHKRLSAVVGFWESTSVFIDQTNHYNILIGLDTTQVDANDRIRVEVNGIPISGTWNATIPKDYTAIYINNVFPNRVGVCPYLDNSYFNGYLSYTCLVDGQQLNSSAFGRFASNGLWVPKKFVGTYGTNGFKLDFADAANMGKDVSGNGNDWATAGDPAQTIDTPTNNQCTLNPLNSEIGWAFSDGNKTCVATGTMGNVGTALANVGVSSGKWYWEMHGNTTNAANLIGVATPYSRLTLHLGRDPYGWAYQGINGKVWNNNLVIATYDTWGENDIIGMALDLDSGTIQFYKNGVAQGSPISGLMGMFYPAVSSMDTSYANITAIFSEHDFTYTPPTGFISLDPVNLVSQPVFLSGTYKGVSLNDNIGGIYVYTNCTLETVTIGSNTYTNDGTDCSVILFTSNGFKLVSGTDNSNGVVYNWTGKLRYPALTSNAQLN